MANFLNFFTCSNFNDIKKKNHDTTESKIQLYLVEECQ